MFIQAQCQPTEVQCNYSCAKQRNKKTYTKHDKQLNSEASCNTMNAKSELLKNHLFAK